MKTKHINIINLSIFKAIKLLTVINCICRFKNQPHMTFDDCRTEAQQEFELQRDPTGCLEYPTKYDYIIG